MVPDTTKIIESEVRPWGGYQVLHRQSGCQVKRIVVSPGLRFSLQKHLKRSEKWVILSGEGRATIGERSMDIRSGMFLEIPKGTTHRLQNTGKDPLVLIEIQFGNYLGEDDIVRFDDDFGRCGKGEV